MHQRRRILRGVALSVACASGLACAQAPTDTAPRLSDCDTPDFARTLHAVPAASPADSPRGYWLDSRHIKWPAAPVAAAPAAAYRLYVSGDNQLALVDGRIRGADRAIALESMAGALPDALASRFKFVPPGMNLRVPAANAREVAAWLRGQAWLVAEDGNTRVLDATSLQLPGALDELYSAAASLPDLGVRIEAGRTSFKLWAPTARGVVVCLHDPGSIQASALLPMERDEQTGSWAASVGRDLSGGHYRFLVDVFVSGVGLVRNRVTDPYSVSLDSDSRRSYIADLESPALMPPGWKQHALPAKVAAQTDMVIYELHVRDFSINDDSVSVANRGRYAAFTERDSRGMRHLRALSDAGLTDVHLLPIFDFATVPETGCVTPAIHGSPSGTSQQEASSAAALRDCFNWGYDPYHFNAPEGSYASSAGDGDARILETRRMVQALHEAGLRVGMDVVYNHTTASGQNEKSVLDRIVPGYYHRVDGKGVVERSTCCDNTATEHAMMAKLMIDSAVLWATQYRIDSFRFDLMGHQPRSAMESLQARVNQAAGREVQLIGEGWNFGEVANGARFVQASQLSLGGSGIGTFSDRARDAVRGGKPSDSGEAMIAQQGYVNGLVYAPNALAPKHEPAELLRTADMVRVGLAGSLREFPLPTYSGETRRLREIAYGDQPAGYVTAPGEVVNYVENHDNQTLFDNNAYKLPRPTSTEDRARVQLLAAAINAFSQGVAYFHAGVDTLRSKSLDRNSFDSGDWFNRIDWSYRDNYFGTGLPRKDDNGKDHALMVPLLDDPAIKPTPADIAFARDGFRDLLRIRASSRLFRLRSAPEIGQRLSFPNTGPAQNPLVLAGRLDGRGLEDAAFDGLLYFINVAPTEQLLVLPTEAGKSYRLHPVHLASAAADRRPVESATFEADSGTFTIPARTALVFVQP